MSIGELRVFMEAVADSLKVGYADGPTDLALSSRIVLSLMDTETALAEANARVEALEGEARTAFVVVKALEGERDWLDDVEPAWRESYSDPRHYVMAMRELLSAERQRAERAVRAFWGAAQDSHSWNHAGKNIYVDNRPYLAPFDFASCLGSKCVEYQRELAALTPATTPTEEKA